jgi:hypothetical protein
MTSYEIKKRGRRSPDIADAQALTFAVPVRRGQSRKSMRARSAAMHYDPFAD